MSIWESLVFIAAVTALTYGSYLLHLLIERLDTEEQRPGDDD